MHYDQGLSGLLSLKMLFFLTFLTQKNFALQKTIHDTLLVNMIIHKSRFQ